MGLFVDARRDMHWVKTTLLVKNYIHVTRRTTENVNKCVTKREKRRCADATSTSNSQKMANHAQKCTFVTVVKTLVVTKYVTRMKTKLSAGVTKDIVSRRTAKNARKSILAT